MDSADNQQIHEEFWQYNLVDLDRALVGLVSQVGRVARMFDQETFEEKYISDGTAKPFRDLAVPYISTFDARSALGYRAESPSQSVPGAGGNVVSNAGVLASTQLSAVQYIVRLPRSVLPVIYKAEEKMRILLHRIIAMAAATLKNHPRGPSLSARIEVPRAKPLERFLPDSFPGPARRGTNVSLAADHKLAADQKDSYAVHHLLTPLVGDESSAFDMSRKYVYRVATIAGLWQFRGLDDDIDEALNIVWQAWTIFSHAAATMPELPTSVHKRLTLAEKLKERDIRDKHVTQLHGSATADPKDFKQPDTITTVAALHSSLTTLAQAASRGRDTRVPVTAGPGHHWSGDRLRWLLQWVSNKEMV